MTIRSLIERAADAGIGLALSPEGQLRVNAPKGVLDAQWRAELGDSKAELIAWLRAQCADDFGPAPQRHDIRVPHPLSHAQQRLWILERIDPGSAAYTIGSAFRVDADIDAPTLVAACTAIVRRHAALRTRFAVINGTPCQQVDDEPRVDFDLLVLPADDEGALGATLEREAGRGFDLEQGPLLRVRLIEQPGQPPVLLVAMHHIVGDGWSNGVFVAELAAHYRAIRAGQADGGLPEIEYQYTDYTHWQRAALPPARLDTLLGYWREALAGWQPLDLVLDRPRPAQPSRHGRMQQLQIDVPTSLAVRRLSREHGCTVFPVLLAAFAILLQRRSGQHDIVIGTDVAQRTRVEWEGLIGFFVNQLVLRADLSGDPTFAELLRRINQRCLDAWAHQDLPFDVLVEKLLDGRDFSVTPFFQVKFILQNTPGGDDASGLERIELPRRHAKFDMTWSVVENGDHFTIDIESASELFEADTVARMADQYAALIAEAVAAPERLISRLRLDAADAHAAAAAQSSRHTRNALDLASFVEQWARERPRAIALTDPQIAVDYAELNRRANRLARLLQQWGVESETPVGVCLGNTTDHAIAAVAIAKAGGVLVPIDPQYPDQRISQIIEASGLPLLVTVAALLDRLPADDLNFIGVLCLDSEQAACAEQSDDDLGLPRHAEQAAYLIFTSGSTGRPKGVTVAAGGLANLAFAQGARFGLANSKRVLQFASVGFDASIWEMLMAFAHGAALCCAPREMTMPGQALAALIAEQRITHLTLPPSALSVMPSAFVESLDVLVLAGEACRDEQVAPLLGGRCAVFNAYGPSETTVCASIADILPSAHGFAGSIGHPIEGVALHVIDVAGQPAAIDVPGELCIGGSALARGYWNDPVQTAARFVPDPHATTPGARLYRSGDRARLRDDGRVEFLGRLDQQIKVRGHRIEPGEIEAALLQQPGIRGAVVVVDPARGELAGYVVTAQEPLDTTALRHALRGRLPEYMIPRSIVVIERIPTTANGKLDVAALPAATERRERAAVDAPQGAIESSIAEIWARLLGLAEVSTRDNFFDVGGHSLLLIQVQEQIRERLQREVGVAELFKYPTVQGLAAYLERGAARVEDTRSDARIAQRRQAARQRSARVAEAAGEKT